MCDWCWGSWSCSFLSPSSGPSLTSRYPQPVPYHPTVPLISQQATQNREICRISLFQFSCSTIKHSTLLFLSILHPLYAVQYIVCVTSIVSFFLISTPPFLPFLLPGFPLDAAGCPYERGAGDSGSQTGPDAGPQSHPHPRLHTHLWVWRLPSRRQMPSAQTVRCSCHSIK